MLFRSQTIYNMNDFAVISFSRYYTLKIGNDGPHARWDVYTVYDCHLKLSIVQFYLLNYTDFIRSTHQNVNSSVLSLLSTLTGWILENRQ